MATILLLFISNTFMSIAWYGHLKDHSQKPLWIAIMVSWGVAFFEYCFMVPANRLGFEKYGFTLTQLKITQECITLLVFLVYAALIFQEKLRWNTVVAMLLVIAAVALAFYGRN